MNQQDLPTFVGYARVLPEDTTPKLHKDPIAVEPEAESGDPNEKHEEQFSEMELLVAPPPIA